MKGMRICQICGGLYPPSAVVCTACYDIVCGQIVARERKPQTEPQEEKPLPPVKVTDLVRFPVNYSKTFWYQGYVESIGTNLLGEVVVRVRVEGRGSQYARLSECVIVTDDDSDEETWDQFQDDAVAASRAYDITPPQGMP